MVVGVLMLPLLYFVSMVPIISTVVSAQSLVMLIPASTPLAEHNLVPGESLQVPCWLVNLPESLCRGHLVCT